jgi:hypothetical protein
VLRNTEVAKNVNKNNAMHAILFEAVALVSRLDVEQELGARCVSLPCSDEKVANRDIRVWHGATEKGP